MTPEPMHGDAGLVREPDLPVANDNEPASRRAPRHRTPSQGEAALSLAVCWRYPEAPLELARAFGEIAADLWLARKLPLTGAHNVATLGHTHAALQDHADEERDRQAEDLGA